MTWVVRKNKWPWRDYLTEEEASEVRDLERKVSSAKHAIVQANMILGPIRNRAIHRAKYASEHLTRQALEQGSAE